ncbi:MAG: hypothetical protein PVJ64_07850 [Gemmatimonadales bacterium]
MRRRWASDGDDPGRAARWSVTGNGSDPGQQRQRRSEGVKREFLARAIVIDCPHADCDGMLLTGAREIERLGGSGARLVFRCTREPESHEVTVTMDPYTAEEVERLKAALYRGEALGCVRCGTLLELGSVSSQDGWAKSLDSSAAFYCAWCGVRWEAPAELSKPAG